MVQTAPTSKSNQTYRLHVDLVKRRNASHERFPTLDPIGEAKVLALSGTRLPMKSIQMATLSCILDRLTRLTAVRHGDCIGADRVAHELVRRQCDGVTIHVHPPTDEKQRAFCETTAGPTEVHPPKPYLKRNRDMIDASDALVAFPKSATEQKRGSGTWATIRYARKIGRPLVIVLPNGDVTC